MIQHGGGRNEDGDIPYGEWTAPYRSPAGAEALAEAQGKRFDFLLGRRTYDIWSGHWPKVDLIVWGSSTLTPVLLDEGVVDDVVLIVYPVLLGRGKRFFSDRVEARELALVSTKATPTGVLLNTYRHVGSLRAAP